MTPEQQRLHAYMLSVVSELSAMPCRTRAQEAAYQVALRDLARFCERHGEPMPKLHSD